MAKLGVAAGVPFQGEKGPITETAKGTGASVPEPFRLEPALGGPSWLHYELEHRLRFEHLANDFRAKTPGSLTGLSARTLARVEVESARLVFKLELEDSRFLPGDGTPLNGTLVNPLEPLQAHLLFRTRNGIVEGDALRVALGRMTVDWGSRRLLARNDFRNTFNGFTGVDGSWTTPGGHSLRALAVLPVLRRPSDTDGAALDAHRVQLDEENTHALLWGLYFSSAPLGGGPVFESYLLAFHEGDSPNVPTTQRKLATPGMRLFQKPRGGHWDYQAEVMVQMGTSRRSTNPEDGPSRTHRAASVHGTLGYRWNLPWAPWGAVVYDYASGDADPNDGVQGRFDPLFGARRFDFAATGLYGAVARSNLSSPGIRFEAQPAATVETALSYRYVGLASSTDAWTSAGVRDPSGRSGTSVGHQWEGRVRWNALPRNLVFEIGGAVLLRGTFATVAPGGRSGTPIYGYAQVTGML